MSAKTIAVVGAGLAGLACARRLVAAGHRVTVFDKARGAGGRIATRRDQRAAWDHGAQYFTVSDPAFAAVVGAAREAGQVAAWKPRWPGGEQEQRDLWVGVPGISALPRWLAQGLDVVPEARVTVLGRSGARWTLVDDRGRSVGGFDAVALAVPAPQAAMLAAPHSEFAARLDAVEMAPCWALMAAFDSPLDVPLDADWSPDAVLPWMARNSSKPRRSGLDAWVLHADPAWSQARLGADPADVGAALLARLGERLATTLPAPVLIEAHRWRYARVMRPLGEPCLLDPAVELGFCGDWCLDARVEAAFLSGEALARRLGD